jgi:hypothetical protein
MLSETVRCSWGAVGDSSTWCKWCCGRTGVPTPRRTGAHHHHHRFAHHRGAEEEVRVCPRMRRRMRKLRIVTCGISGGRCAHAAVSRRPIHHRHQRHRQPRTEGYRYASKVCALSVVQGPFSARPVPNPTRSIRNFRIAVRQLCTRAEAVSRERSVPDSLNHTDGVLTRHARRPP